MLSSVFAVGYLLTAMISAPPVLSGLSTVLGTSMIVMQNSSMFTALASMQLLISIGLLGLLVFCEVTAPAYGGKGLLVQLRTNWLPHVVVLFLIFSLMIVVKAITILSTPPA